VTDGGYPLESDPRLVDPDVEAPISRISDFEMLRELADHDGVRSYLAERKGAFGFTKRVMLKVASSPFQDGLDIALRLTDEARLGMRLSHPNLLQTLDLGRDGDRFFLVREWVDGLGLRALMHRTWSRGEEFPRPALLRIAVAVCRVLSYLHGLRSPPWAPTGVIHRGVAPSNILLSRAGETRLANLFMAKASGRIDGRVDVRNQTRLIPAYCAPELEDGRPAKPVADIFSLGAVLYEGLLGPDAFGGDSNSDWLRFRDDEDMAERIEAADLSEDLRVVLVRATASSPTRRYPAADGLGGDLRRILRDEYRSDGDRELRKILAQHLAAAS
jgi:eukaryotic-like serine/threonine-protein kinase